MNRAPQSWLLPAALVGYVSLAAMRGQQGWTRWWALFVPLILAWGLRAIGRRAESGHLQTAVQGARLGWIGLGFYAAAFLGAPDNAALRAASATGQGLLVVGALLSIARQTPPPGLLQGHPAARSLDALIVATILWSATTAAILLRALAPDTFPLDPIALDLALIFAAMGSLLLLCASLLRTKLLRGLEMGVGDRAQAALALAVAGTAIGAGSGFVEMATSDRLAGASLTLTCIGVILSVSAPDAAVVTRTVRGLVALLLLGIPVALAGAWVAMRIPDRPATVALVLAGMSMLVGLIARTVARPLAPEGSRWLTALKEGMSAALHPQPEMALRAGLMALRKAEPTSKTRPEVFRLDPPAMLSVDIAGYLTDQTVEFPEGVLAQAVDEPGRTLRLESLLAAEVRQPKVRPLVTWFQAHSAKTATVLMDEAGPVGLLVLPRGIRKSPLSMEESELLSALAERLAGLISVSASLRRSRDRELTYQKQKENADAKAAELQEQLEEQQRSDHLEAEAQVEVLRAAAHSPGAQIKLQELEAAVGPTVTLHTPIGVDPLPWAAHLHLHRLAQRDPVERRPLVLIDLSEKQVRSQELWNLESDESPWRRAARGTLVLLHPGSLPEESQIHLATALEESRPWLTVICQSPKDEVVRRLSRQFEGPEISLPTLLERPEDLQALIINELSQLGLTQRGTPYGIAKGALFELIQRPFPGNDAELKGLLAAAAGHAQGDRVELDDLRAITHDHDTPDPPPAHEVRTRARLAPRARRR